MAKPTVNKNQESVVDALHALLDKHPDVSELLSSCSKTAEHTVLDILNAALAPVGVGPLALLVDGKGSVMGVGVRRKQ